MSVLGIEFSGQNMIGVLVGPDGGVVSTHKLSVGESRSRAQFAAFQNAFQSLVQSLNPKFIAIKEKPEKGKMAAGAIAMKMEGIVLANSLMDVLFVSGRLINQCDAEDSSLKVYQVPAFKAASAIHRKK